MQHSISPEKITSTSTSTDGRDDDVPIAEARCGIATYLGEDETCRGGIIKPRNVLNALLDYALKLEGRSRIAKLVLKELESVQGVENKKQALVDLADTWLNHLIYPIYAASESRARLPFDEETPPDDDTATLIESASRDEQRSLLELLYKREGNRCAITRKLACRNGKRAVPNPDEEYEMYLQAVQIIPLPLGSFGNDRVEMKEASMTLEMLEMWTSMDFRGWVASNINRPENAILLTLDARYFLAEFIIWFEPTDVPGTYFVRSNRCVEGRDKQVTFVDRSDSGVSISLPDPNALAIHAAFAHVLNATGARDYFEDVWDNRRYMHVLENDGSSNLGLLLSSLVLDPVEKNPREKTAD